MSAPTHSADMSNRPGAQGTAKKPYVRIVTDKRREQNRRAQKAYRERLKKKLEVLEEQAAALPRADESELELEPEDRYGHALSTDMDVLVGDDHDPIARLATDFISQRSPQLINTPPPVIVV